MSDTKNLPNSPSNKKDQESLEHLILEYIRQDKKPFINLEWIKDQWPILIFIGTAIWWMSGLVTMKTHTESLQKLEEKCKVMVKESEERRKSEIQMLYKQIER